MGGNKKTNLHLKCTERLGESLKGFSVKKYYSFCFYRAEIHISHEMHFAKFTLFKKFTCFSTPFSREEAFYNASVVTR